MKIQKLFSLTLPILTTVFSILVGCQSGEGFRKIANENRNVLWVDSMDPKNIYSVSSDDHEIDSEFSRTKLSYVGEKFNPYSSEYKPITVIQYKTTPCLEDKLKTWELEGLKEHEVVQVGTMTYQSCQIEIKFKTKYLDLESPFKVDG
ncbi:MAG: hypothetical protein ACOYL6_13965 [Bacteriovoracaceae bacterium]